MAAKPRVKKPVVKKPPNVVAKKDVVAKSPAPSKPGKVSNSKEQVVNAETAQVLRDADAGKNLLHYASLDEMFKDLGI